jgi:hypothetical protein
VPGAGGDEDGGRLVVDVGGVPGAGRVDRVLTGAQRDRGGRPVGVLLVQGHRAGGTQHDFVTDRVHLPDIPGFGERVHGDEPGLGTVGGVVAGAVPGVPLHSPGELGFDFGRRAETEVDRMDGEFGRFAHVPIIAHGARAPTGSVRLRRRRRRRTDRAGRRGGRRAPSSRQGSRRTRSSRSARPSTCPRTRGR